jgi:putative CocE/NonD family hydrolase
MVADPSELDTVTHVANVWIPMRDGIRLGASLWLPQGCETEPVPALLEYIPYRKSDLTAPTDARVGPWFAARGYAYVRVDLRGAGESDGILPDEYLPQEQDDAVEVLAWLEAQSWCTGSVGMIGFSWGGFAGLQVAARRPPQLKAVISMYSTDDRYADDVHYLGGCLNAFLQLPWASYILAHNALPPDPETVGDRWREMWFDRLEHTPPNIDPWMTHQRKDAYWKHASVNEDYDAIACPVYMVGGWADGYVNAVLRFVEGHRGVRKALIGPWGHHWPQEVTPGPAVGFLQECLRWWDRWLKDEDNGIDREPIVRAYLQEPYRPQAAHLPRDGRWVAEADWPSGRIEWRRFELGDHTLGGEPSASVGLTHRGVHRHGMLAGGWCPGDVDHPSDQREEDALCLTFTSEPLAERLELLGRPRVRLAVAVDEPVALVVARLCRVSPDGTSTLITRSALNLTHRDSHEQPSELVAGQRYEVAFDLNVVGQAIAAGDRLRLALSTTYWPWLWPSPKDVELTVFTGEGSVLELPVRPPAAADADPMPFGPPDQAPPLRREVLASAPAFHSVRRDPMSGMLEFENDPVGTRTSLLLDADLEVSTRYHDLFSIREHDPLSACVTCERSFGLARGAWRIRVDATSTMTSTATEFQVDDTLEAFEGERRVFVKTWSRSFPRDLV